MFVLDCWPTVVIVVLWTSCHIITCSFFYRQYGCRPQEPHTQNGGGGVPPCESEETERVKESRRLNDSTTVQAPMPFVECRQLGDNRGIFSIRQMLLAIGPGYTCFFESRRGSVCINTFVQKYLFSVMTYN